MLPPDCDPDGDEAEETHSGRLERTAEAFRFPGKVIDRTLAAGEILPPFFSLLQRKKTTGRAGMLPDSFSFKSLKK